MDFKGLSGSENLSGLNNLNRHDTITGLNDLNSLFGLKSQKLLALYNCLHTEWFSWYQEPQQPEWPQQPQWPQWPQWPWQPHFLKKLTELDVSINPCTKMVAQCGKNHQKSTIFLSFGHPSELRLWRTGMLFLTKSKGQQSNVHYQRTYRCLLFGRFWVQRPCKCYLHYGVLRSNTL